MRARLGLGTAAEVALLASVASAGSTEKLARDSAQAMAIRFWARNLNTLRALLRCHANNDGGGAVVHSALGAKAPVQIVALGRHVHWAIAFVAVAQTVATR